MYTIIYILIFIIKSKKMKFGINLILFGLTGLALCQDPIVGQASTTQSNANAGGAIVLPYNLSDISQTVGANDNEEQFAIQQIQGSQNSFDGSQGTSNGSDSSNISLTSWLPLTTNNQPSQDQSQTQLKTNSNDVSKNVQQQPYQNSNNS